MKDNKNIANSNIVTDALLPETAILRDEVERIMDPDAEDVLWFSLKKGDMDFKIGLSDILRCLKFAEDQGEVPELPRMWWTRLSGVYPKLDVFLE